MAVIRFNIIHLPSTATRLICCERFILLH